MVSSSSKVGFFPLTIDLRAGCLPSVGVQKAKTEQIGFEVSFGSTSVGIGSERRRIGTRGAKDSKAITGERKRARKSRERDCWLRLGDVARRILAARSGSAGMAFSAFHETWRNSDELGASFSSLHRRPRFQRIQRGVGIEGIYSKEPRSFRILI